MPGRGAWSPPAMTSRQRLRWGQSSGHMEAYDPDVVDLRDWDQVESWQTSLGFDIANGGTVATNSVTPFTAADIGKKVIYNRDSGGRRLATILDVDSSGNATLDNAASGSSTNQRVQWGFDNTAVIQDALDELADTTGAIRRVTLAGLYRLSQLAIPSGIDFQGGGLGTRQLLTGAPAQNVGYASLAFQQIPGTNKPMIVFQPTDVFGGNFWGPGRLANMELLGPEPDVQNAVSVSGSGLSMRTTDNEAITVVDGGKFERLTATQFLGSGFEFWSAGLPLYLDDIRAYYCGDYGIDIGIGTGSINAQALELGQMSSDGCRLGGLRLKGLANWSSVHIRSLKSEKGDVQTAPGANTEYQESALILEECDDTPVNIGALTHICGRDTGTALDLAKTAPGPAIVIRSATNLRPRVRMNAVRCRLKGDELVNVANAVTLRDEVIGVDVPQTVTSGAWPPDAQTDMADVDALTTGESAFPRGRANSQAAIASGVLRMVMWTAKKTNKAATGIVVSVKTAATSSTLCKAFIGTVGSNGAVTILETVSATTKLDATGRQKFSFAANRTILAGQRLCVGILWVGGGTQPQIQINSSDGNLTGQAPRTAGVITSLADVPASPISSGSIGDTGSTPYVEIV